MAMSVSRRNLHQHPLLQRASANAREFASLADCVHCKVMFIRLMLLFVIVVVGCKSKTATPEAIPGYIEPWSEGEVLRVDPGRVAIAIEPGRDLEVGGAINGVAWEDWIKQADSTRTRLTSGATLRGARLNGSVTFTRGNPQVEIAWSASTVSHDAAREPIVVRYVLPAGDLRYVDVQQRLTPFVGNDVEIPPAAPRWIEWRGAQRTVVFSQWRADSVYLSEVDGGIALDFAIFVPDRRADPRCVGDPAKGFDAELLLTFGEDAAVFASRLAEGREAAVVPIFEDGGANDLAKDGASTSAEDYARRIRTLALGHSDPTDPRHGNGGFVGTSLGATFLVGAAAALNPAMAALGDALDGTTVDLAVQNEDATATVICAEGGLPKTKQVIQDGEDGSGSYHNDVASVPVYWGGWPATWKVPILEGQRESITSQILSKPYLDQAQRDRAIVVFKTPLVATRNPLVEAYSHSLITPERQGQWTIAPELERALADVELNHESLSHAVISADDLLEQIRQAWSVRIQRRQQGAWKLDGVMLGLTLVIPGVHAVSVNGTPARTRTPSTGSPQTWVILDLDGTATLQVADVHKLNAVKWVFE